MGKSWRRTGLSALMLLATILAVGLLLSVLGGAVMIPQGGALIVFGGALAVFLAVQLLLFRVLGLRSRADERGAADEAEDAEWRAWRG